MQPVPHPSPNFGERRNGVLPDLIVLHYTAMTSAPEALARLCDPIAEVSAHYLIDPKGTVHALVAEEMRAWHAGAGAWGAVRDVNSRSVGIELQNCGREPFAAAQMAALEDLLEGVMDRWQIPPERVIGHSDMSPGRKIDPGPRFDWRRLARQGLSVWPEADGEGQGGALAFMSAAKAFGHTASEDPETVLAAVRLRFRPWTRGPLERADVALIAGLAARYPVDRSAVSP